MNKLLASGLLSLATLVGAYAGNVAAAPVESSSNSYYQKFAEIIPQFVALPKSVQSNSGIIVKMPSDGSMRVIWRIDSNKSANYALFRGKAGCTLEI